MTASTTAPTRIVSLLAGTALSAGLILGSAPAAHAGGGHGKAEFRHHGSGSEARAEWSQGRSPSDPDGDSNGGQDKPGFRGGFDDDRDGNNGCGNDTDREDDNNGNCGRLKDRSEAEVRAVRDWWAVKVSIFKSRAAEVKAAWLAALERCRDEANMDDDDPIETEVGAVVVAKKCKCDEAEAIVSTAGVVTPVEAQVVVTPAPVVATPAPAVEPPAAEVAGTVETAAPADAATTTTTAPETTSTTVPTEVMGISETAPDALARTGAGAGALALAAGLCLGAGRLLNVLKRRLDS